MLPLNMFLSTIRSLFRTLSNIRSSHRRFFSYLGFLSRPSMNFRAAGKGQSISLAPGYRFHPLRRRLHISRAIAAGISPLRIGGSRGSNREPLASERKLLTTKQCALKTLEYSANKIIVRNFAKFIGKHLLKEKLWHWYFPVNFAKLLRAPFLQNTSL